MSVNTPLTAMRQAEERLAGALGAAPGEIDRIGTGKIDGALARLEAAVQNAGVRLQAAMQRMNGLIGEVTAELEQLACGILEDTSSTKALAAPVVATATRAVEPARTPA